MTVKNLNGSHGLEVKEKRGLFYLVINQRLETKTAPNALKEHGFKDSPVSA